MAPKTAQDGVSGGLYLEHQAYRHQGESMIGSWPDLVVVLVGFVLFGAKNIPELGRNLGRGLREFKSGMNDLKNEIETTLEDKPRPAQTVTSRATAAVTSPTVAAPETQPSSAPTER